MFPNADAASQFAVDMRNCALPPEVNQAALMCLADWFGVAAAGSIEQAGVMTRTMVEAWKGRGRAPVLGGSDTFAAGAALINATMAHCLDFDDIHHGSAAHLSAPTWAAALAVGFETNARPDQIIRAFVGGYEVAARLGGNGVGHSLNRRGIHSTGIIGCLSAATAAAILLDLDQKGVQRALGAAAAQASGLIASFGTMAKPFASGKAAFNGVIAAELAQAGFEPPLNLFEKDKTLYAALIQDRSSEPGRLDFSTDWQILRNTFKLYASCLLTHPAIEAARAARARISGRGIKRAVLSVNPAAIEIAGKTDPKSPLEGKFSLAFCVALALHGIWPSHREFCESRLMDPAIRATMNCITVNPETSRPVSSARLEVVLADEEIVEGETQRSFGDTVEAIGWDELESKFNDLIGPFCPDTPAVFEEIKTFDRAGDVQALRHAFGAVSDHADVVAGENADLPV